MATTHAKSKIVRSAPARKTVAVRKPTPLRGLLASRPRNAVLATLATVICGAGLAAVGYALMRHESEDRVYPGSAARRDDEGNIRHAGQESMRTGNRTNGPASIRLPMNHFRRAIRRAHIRTD
jgi:hypothetical protein